MIQLSELAQAPVILAIRRRPVLVKWHFARHLWLCAIYKEDTLRYAPQPVRIRAVDDAVNAASSCQTDDVECTRLEEQKEASEQLLTKERKGHFAFRAPAIM
uniref:Uncharacterized protein n=1 Tax=Angiostrongylus cantonensis TaxID=6313 RepID=A0A0K0DE57_ANGCA